MRCHNSNEILYLEEILLYSVQRTETGIKFSKDLWIYSYSAFWSESECLLFVFVYLESGLFNRSLTQAHIEPSVWTRHVLLGV